jgi:hypothetical protein
LKPRSLRETDAQKPKKSRINSTKSCRWVQTTLNRVASTRWDGRNQASHLKNSFSKNTSRTAIDLNRASSLLTRRRKRYAKRSTHWKSK